MEAAAQLRASAVPRLWQAILVAGLAALALSYMDGTGYPDGLAGEEIPLAARIIAACDAYSAMTSDRPYRAARTPAAAVAELRRCAGRQFDCQVVELRCAVLVDEAEPARLAVGT
jgi:HD-GYP domain-containing protein (c-di-GMP phosphodiesterase class II)